MTLRIKNMVCPRCVAAVRQVLEETGSEVRNVTLGEAEIRGELSDEAKARIGKRLSELGFELLEDRRSRIIEAVKNSLIGHLHSASADEEIRLSEFLGSRIGLDYKYLSSLFSETEGRTIENYYIALKIERVKELLVYDEMTLSEIAWRLGYSSVAHLSAQFKRVTGLTPSRYKRSSGGKRRSLDEV